MSELTHDEDGFHEIQLSGKQIVALFMATSVVLVSIFLCGVAVGRGVRAQQLDETAEPAVTTQGELPDAAAGGEVPPPSEATPESPVVYDRLLRGEKPEDPQVKSQPSPEAAPVQATPPPPPPAAARPAAPEIDVPTSGRPGQWVLQVTALQNRASATQIVKRLLDKGHPAYLQIPAPDAPVIYRVRLGGFKDRREAENLAVRLQKEEQFKPVVTRR